MVESVLVVTRLPIIAINYFKSLSHLSLESVMVESVLVVAPPPLFWLFSTLLLLLLLNKKTKKLNQRKKDKDK